MKRRAVRSSPIVPGVRRRWLLVLIAPLFPAAAHAQIDGTLLVQPAIPPGFDRGRNVSVSERSRQDFDPLGIDVGSFRLNPRLATGAGGTSNTYLTAGERQASAFLYLQPSVVAVSQWSRHQVRLQAAAALRNYLGQSRRNEATWNASASGRLDVTRSYTVTAQAAASRNVENLFSGDVTSDIAALSRIETYSGLVRAQYVGGRARAQLAADFGAFRYDPVRLVDETLRDQSQRDRDVARLTGQLDFAVTPSVSYFAQATYARTNFFRPLVDGQPERDSTDYRILGGLNFDLAGRARGSLGVGFIHREYRATTFTNVSGISVQAQLELFPTELTSLTFAASRVIQDSTLNVGNPYFESQVSARVDHELLRNVILNATTSYAKQDYLGSNRSADVFQVGLGARYLTPSRFGVEAGISYGDRSTQGNALGTGITEIRGQAGVVIQL